MNDDKLEVLNGAIGLGAAGASTPDVLHYIELQGWAMVPAVSVNAAVEPRQESDLGNQLEEIRARALRMADEYDRDPLIGGVIASALRLAVSPSLPA